MLIVGREIGQSVIIDDEIKVTVLQTGCKPRLVIDAPKHVPITKESTNINTITNLKHGKVIGIPTRIGDKVKVTMIQTDSGLIRFAIDAPKEIRVFREELHKRKSIKDLSGNC